MAKEPKTPQVIQMPPAEGDGAMVSTKPRQVKPGDLIRYVLHTGITRGEARTARVLAVHGDGLPAPKEDPTRIPGDCVEVEIDVDPMLGDTEHRWQTWVRHDEELRTQGSWHWPR